MAKPVLVVAPLIVAEGRRYSPVIGGGYSCETGTWRNTPTSFAYQWFRNGVLIPGATQQNYTPSYEDERWPLQCRVTATNADGSTVTMAADDTAKCVEGAYPPVLLAYPYVDYSDPISVGDTVTCNPGVWGGKAPLSYTYQWFRDGNAIPGAKAQTYAPTNADIDHRLMCIVKAINADGSMFAYSDTTTPVEPQLYVPPANTSAPVVTGQPYVGQLLSCANGTWSGDTPLTYTRQWFRNTTAISGATNSTYVVQAGDVGASIHCDVTATNPGGTATATSNAIGPIVSAPVNTTAPVISGTPTVGQTLSCTTGTWSPTGTYTYQWRQNGANISGATSSTYVLQLADVGASITCAVTATNLSGQSTAVSNALGPVADNATPPVNTVAPVVTGTPAVGNTLSCSTGTWTGTTPITYDYNWTRTSPLMPADPRNGPMPHAEPSYIIGEEDIGFIITCTVTATNRAGSANAVSNGVLVPVPVLPPEIDTLPVITGTPAVGQTLTCSTGTWNGTAPFTYAYQWQRDGANIPGATTNTHLCTASDFNTRLECVVTATNSAGGSSVSTLPTAPVAGTAPANTVLPAITGTVRVGQTLTCSTGTWSGYPAPTYAYQWKRGGADIAGATSSTYLLADVDYNTVITCTVTATNTYGPASATSAGTTAVAGTTPANTVAPTISGGTTVGGTLICGVGTWTGVPTPTYTYQWLRNDVDIAGATNSTYTLVTADLGANIKCRVTATNPAGSASATSTALGPITPAIQFVGAANASGTTITIPAHQAGDLIIMCAERISGGMPTIPSGWTEIKRSTTGINVVWCGRVATASGTTSGTWTGANDLSVAVYRGVSGVGASAIRDGAAWPGLSLQVTNGTSWVVGMGISTSNASGPTVPSGRTTRTSGNYHRAWDTNGGVTSWSEQTITGTNVVCTMELKN